MIIILNGTSSSGKTTLAKALLSILDDRYFFFSVDNFLIHSMPEDINMEVKEDLILLDKAISGFNQSFSVIADNIPFIIIDHVLQKESWFHELFEAIKNKPSLFVHVTAPLDVIETREASRDDRAPGTAKNQYEQISKYKYDLTIDTHSNSLEKSVQLVIEALGK
jgi:chloramphenicol 3-O phosphotransferase